MATNHGRVWRFLFVLHLYAFIAVMSIVFLTAGSAVLAWKVPQARRFVHSEVVRFYLRKVAPKLPFEIQDVQVEAKWKEFIHGWIRGFSIRLKWQTWQVELSGPIQISWDKKESEPHLSATFLSKADIRSPGFALSEIPLRLAFRAEENFNHLDSLSLQSNLPELRLDLARNTLHLNLKDFSLGATWSDSQTQIELSADALEASDPAHGRKLRLDQFSLSSSAPLKVSPLQIGPEAHLDLSASQLTAHWEDRSIRLPVSRYPIHSTLSVSRAVEKSVTGKIDVRAGSRPERPEFQVSAQVDQGKLHIDWSTPNTPLAGFAHLAASVFGEPGEDPLQEIQKLSGSLKTQGRATVPWPLTPASLEKAEFSSHVVAHQIRFEWPAKLLAVDDLDLDLPISSREGVDGDITISRLLYRRFHASLPKTSLRLKPEDPSRKQWKIEIDASKLNVRELPLKLGSIVGILEPARSAGLKSKYELHSSLHLAATELTSLAHSFCTSNEHIPPAQLVANFPKVSWTSDSLDPEGDLQVRLFNGTIDVQNIGIYDLNTKVPEVDFDLDMDGVRLDQLGDWAGFGRMDGTLSAYAHDVVFQAWLPTQYDFRFEAKPLSEPKVVFSPDAMKNLARLVASSAIDHLPGIANWMAFGLPSRLLGGFDIWFVGISLYSHNGHILLEVLDPPGLPINVAHDHKQNHYILYANRFTIPLKTSQYPVVVDATAVSNYVHSAALKLQKLRELKKAKEKAQHEKEPVDCDPPTL